MPLRVSYRIFFKNHFCGYNICDDVWGPLSGKGRGTPKFFQKSVSGGNVHRCWVYIGVAVYTVAYILWCVYWTVYVGVCIGAVADSVVFLAESAIDALWLARGQKFFQKSLFQVGYDAMCLYSMHLYMICGALEIGLYGSVVLGAVV